MTTHFENYNKSKQLVRLKYCFNGPTQNGAVERLWISTHNSSWKSYDVLLKKIRHLFTRTLELKLLKSFLLGFVAYENYWLAQQKIRKVLGTIFVNLIVKHIK